MSELPPRDEPADLRDERDALEPVEPAGDEPATGLEPVAPAETGLEPAPAPGDGEPEPPARPSELEEDEREQRRRAREQRRGDRPQAEGMVPARAHRRFAVERIFVRLIATGGIVAVAVVLGAILTLQDVAGWTVGLVIGLVTVVLAALLWSSREL